jgi:ubiquinone/menaquinone biosynthesis C-methylase UbiE
MRRVDYQKAAWACDGQRALSPATAHNWRTAIQSHVHGEVGVIVDVGSGTGIWSGLLAAWLGARVAALEPSAGMRSRATAKRQAGVVNLAGRAESLPLRGGSCGAAWLSTVIHHLDLGKCAAELDRVLPPPGIIMIPSSFPERSHGFAIRRFFPEACRTWNSFPTAGQTIAAFAVAGFRPDSLESVRESPPVGLSQFRTRVIAMRGADSLLASLGDRAFGDGLARNDDAIAHGETGVAPGSLDLLILRRRDLAYSPELTSRPPRSATGVKIKCRGTRRPIAH